MNPSESAIIGSHMLKFNVYIISFIFGLSVPLSFSVSLGSERDCDIGAHEWRRERGVKFRPDDAFHETSTVSKRIFCVKKQRGHCRRNKTNGRGKRKQRCFLPLVQRAGIHSEEFSKFSEFGKVDWIYGMKGVLAFGDDRCNWPVTDHVLTSKEFWM